MVPDVYLLTFLIAMILLKEGSIHFGPWFERLHPIMAGKVWQCGHEATVRKQRETGAVAHQAFPFPYFI